MANLYSSLLPPYSLLDPSLLNFSHHHRNISPSSKFKFGAATVINHGAPSQTRHIPISRNAVKGNLSLNRNTESSNCLSLLNNKKFSDCRQIHAQIIKLNALNFDRIIGNKLAILYAKSKGLLDDARKLFDEIPHRTIPSYATLIGSYSRSEKWEDVFLILGMMIDDGMLPDKYLVPTILKACCAKQFLRSGKMVHGYVIKMDLGFDIYVENALINLYSSCGDLKYSRNVFDNMKEKDVVSWTALVSAYMEEGLIDEAVNVFDLMQGNGIEPDLISWNALVAGFSKNGKIYLALESLEKMQEKKLNPIVNTWNGIISGCVQNGNFEDAMDVFNKMLNFPEHPNVVTIVCILPTCAGLKELNLGRTIHGYAIKHGLCGHEYVDGSLIDMYSKCGMTDYAEKIFNMVSIKNTAMWNEMIGCYVNKEKMEEATGLLNVMINDGSKPDVITYNTILSGYAKKGRKNEAFKLLFEMTQMNINPNIVTFNVMVSGFQQAGLSYEALKLFGSMQSIKPDSITINGALAACSDLNNLKQGKEIHGFIVRNFIDSNIFLSSALVDMYAKCNDMNSAFEVFCRVKEKNTVSWNVLITGHIYNNQHEIAFRLFRDMLEEGLEPSLVTFMILLRACADMAALRVGREFHAYILKGKLDNSFKFLASALIDMYAKCGSIVDAKLIFEYEDKNDVALWNAMISSYLIHGQAKDAFDLFKKMENLGIFPDHITFLEILSSCARDCLVKEGWEYFNLMEEKYRITPGLEHYTCMVRILGGSGLLDEALDFIKRMSFTPDSCLWVTLLQACRTHSNPKIGEKAAKALFELEPNNASNYILLSNIYVSSGMWNSAKNLRNFMKNRSLMTEIKECSFVNVGSKIRSFKGGMNFCLNLDEILKTWDDLAREMKRNKYCPHDPVLADDDDDETLDPFSCLHTEKLAMCYGILSMNPGRPIRISKNIRMCIDCHTSAKMISKIEKREIFVKDSCFYHHFENGICCCQDRW